MKSLVAFAFALALLTTDATAQWWPLKEKETEMCHQTRIKLAQMIVDFEPAVDTIKAIDAKGDINKASLADKRWYVRAMTSFAQVESEGAEIVALRRINKCQVTGQDKAFIEGDDLEFLKTTVFKIQALLSLAENGGGPWAEKSK